MEVLIVVLRVKPAKVSVRTGQFIKTLSYSTSDLFMTCWLKLVPNCNYVNEQLHAVHT